ncbi:ATP-dependent Clp protease ATP-binding subunit ClpA [Nonomuraea thailandensis]|uniref:ATP-dependent Clp protease ATP-binding subunit ClpA n=1 Tax=Nonomuraea thailandensis TaxID=1188745 RepID=A0A9X2GYZ6_9ACTN|nr:ATP-dependent Clp protease ATP-binding subunit ClpA [Nonomuraea thailandensis]
MTGLSDREVRSGELFERFTDRARRVLVLAQEEARALDHHHIGTEHLLLGMIREGEAVAAKALEGFGVGIEGARRQVVELVGRGETAAQGHLPFTARASRALQLAGQESTDRGLDYIGTEHLLLGLVREGTGTAVQALVKLGADPAGIRQAVDELVARYQAPRT